MIRDMLRPRPLLFYMLLVSSDVFSTLLLCCPFSVDLYEVSCKILCVSLCYAPQDAGGLLFSKPLPLQFPCFRGFKRMPEKFLWSEPASLGTFSIHRLRV